MNKKIVLVLLLIGLFVGSASALVFYNQQGEPVVPCGQSVFECITSEKLDKSNDTSLLVSTVLNKKASVGQSGNVLWRG
jgi:hypothetical protein